VSAVEDPIFDPWSADGPTAEELQPPDWLVNRSTQPDFGAGVAHVVRALAAPRLEAISRRLAVARHATAIQDLLDGAPRLLRFELTPWAGPFAGSGPGPQRPKGPAMLEIGLGTAADDVVTAWYWLDRNESPDQVVSVPTATLSASWIDRVVLDFVRKALARR
jgi:hypothetical protein